VIGEKARSRLANTEAELSKIVRTIAEDLGWRVFWTRDNYSGASSGSRKIRSVGGTSKGYPDLTLARNHNVLWIELKVNGNGMSVEQIQWMRDLPVVVLVTDRWSSEEVRRLLA
jgi:hypothetical protein